MKFLTLTAAVITAGMIAGCGNQMFRQPSYQPLDTPRGSPPLTSIPVDDTKAPDDATPVVSPATGDSQLLSAPNAPSSFPIHEDDLPAANLSDNARNMPAPKVVDGLKSPLDLADPQFINGGHILFLNRCVECHNAGGYGYGVVGSYLDPHPPDLACDLVQHNSDGAIFWHITMGQGKMPGFKTWTTPDERWALTAYVRSLKDADPAKEKLIAPHVTDTTSAPYPVYGEQGFEQGKNVAPFKVLGGAGSQQSSRVYTDAAQPHELSDSGTR